VHRIGVQLRVSAEGNAGVRGTSRLHVWSGVPLRERVRLRDRAPRLVAAKRGSVGAAALNSRPRRRSRLHEVL